MTNVAHEGRKRASKAYTERQKKSAPLKEVFAIEGRKLIKLMKTPTGTYSRFIGLASNEEIKKYDSVYKAKASL